MLIDQFYKFIVRSITGDFFLISSILVYFLAPFNPGESRFTDLFASMIASFHQPLPFILSLFAHPFHIGVAVASSELVLSL